MKLIQLFFLLFSVVIFSQVNNRFVYEYKMAPDINRRDSIVTNYMNLDSDGKVSYFYNAKKYEMDSIMRATGKVNNLLGMGRYDQNLNYEIRKNNNNTATDFYSKFSGVNVWIPEKEDIQWTLVNESKKIGMWNCQKAITNYKGRTWEAWFTDEVPISDGPYKFRGLPGLIVSIKDEENNHFFELIQIKKIHEIFTGISENKMLKKLTMKDFISKLNQRKFNPKTDVDFMNYSNLTNIMTIATKDGNYINLNSKELEKYKDNPEKYDAEVARRLRISNNPIELHQ